MEPANEEKPFASMGEARRVVYNYKQMIDKLKAENAELREKVAKIESQKKTNGGEEINDWAGREIKRLMERERKGAEGNGAGTGTCNARGRIRFKPELEYVDGCAKSALKAYRCLVDDGHSGLSICITKSILDKLIDHKPLTPLTGDDDEWNEISVDEKEHSTLYQNNRYSALFKTVFEDGHVDYRDYDRFDCVDKNNPHDRYHNGFITKKVIESGRQIAQMAFPYVPLDKPVEIVCEEILTDYAHGDYDTIHIDSLRYNEPNTGTFVSDAIHRYFKEEGGDMVEITRSEWLERQVLARKLKERFDQTYNEVKAEHPAYEDWEVYRATMRILNPVSQPHADVCDNCGVCDKGCSGGC